MRIFVIYVIDLRIIKLIIHFGEDKTKSMLFASKFKRKNIKKLHIKHGNIDIK